MACHPGWRTQTKEFVVCWDESGGPECPIKGGNFGSIYLCEYKTDDKKKQVEIHFASYERGQQVALPPITKSLGKGWFEAQLRVSLFSDPSALGGTTWEVTMEAGVNPVGNVTTGLSWSIQPSRRQRLSLRLQWVRLSLGRFRQSLVRKVLRRK